MSGPKTSRYTLTAEQRRILLEQQKTEQRKAAASEKAKRSLKKINEVIDRFQPDKQIADEVAARTGDDGGFYSMFGELQRLFVNAQQIFGQTNFNQVDSVEQTAASLADCLAKMQKQAEKLSAIAVENMSRLNTNLHSAIDEGFSTSFSDIRGQESTIVLLRNKAIQQLKQLQRNDAVPVHYKEEMDAVLEQLCSISDESYLKNYIALTATPMVKKIRGFLDKYTVCHDEFEKLYSEYQALCELYGYVAQEYVCSAASVQTLRDEVQRIKAIAAQDAEQAYIADCLDEVMTEMGYSVLGSREVTRRNGRHFRSELYSYEDGTAVNVTYSADGRIAMELGGIDTSDRLPDAKEAVSLCDSMEHFCGDFQKVEEKLYERGVVIAERVSLLPPAPEYAQIINTSDYTMNASGIVFGQKRKQHMKSSKRKEMLSE